MMQKSIVRADTWRRRLLSAAILAGSGLLATSALAQTVSRTDWQMYIADEVHYDRSGRESPYNGAPQSYRFADIPPQVPGEGQRQWVPAPDPQIINYLGVDGDEVSRIENDPANCRRAYDYAYFQTVVTVPTGTEVSDFRIDFDGMDDGSRITIFNERYPDGTPDMPDGVNNFVRYGEQASMDLARFLSDGDNRVVITQVDDCPSGNKFRRAEVVLDGRTIGATRAVGVASMVPSTYGDVHIRNGLGVSYDVNATGDFILTRNGSGTVEFQARYASLPDLPGTSVMTALSAAVAGDRVEIYFGDASTADAVYVNGQLVEDLAEIADRNAVQTREDLSFHFSPWRSEPIDLPQGGKLMVMSYHSVMYYLFLYQQVFPEDDEDTTLDQFTHFLAAHDRDVGVNQVVNAFVSVDPLANGGLLGRDWSSSGEPRLWPRDATEDEGFITLPAAQEVIDSMAESWRVMPAESLFHARPAGPREPTVPPITLSSLSEDVRIDAAVTCLREGVTDVNLLRDCTLDVGKTGNPGFAVGAAEVQAMIDANPDAPTVIVATGIDPIEEIGAAVVQAAEAIIAEETGASATAGPLSQDEPRTVVGYGDVHLRTHGGIAFDVPLTGDFLLNEANGLVIQARFSEWNGTPGTSVISAMAATIQGRTVEFYLGNEQGEVSVYVDGAEVDPMSMTASDDLIVHINTVDVRTGVVVYYRRSLLFFIGSSAEDGGSEITFGGVNVVGGLLGDRASPPADSLVLRGGDILAMPASEADIIRYAESWRVSPEDSLLRSRPPETPQPSGPAIALADLPEEIRIDAAAACMREGVIDINLLRDCTLDVGKTGHAGFAASAGRVQEAIDANPDAPPVVVATGIHPIDEIGAAVLQAADAMIAEETGASAAAGGLSQEGPQTIVAYGDVHLRTHGGITFDAPLTGDFILNAGEGNYIEIQARFSEWNGEPGTSVISAMAAEIDEKTVEVYFADDGSDAAVYIDGNEIRPESMSATDDIFIIKGTSGGRTSVIVLNKGNVTLSGTSGIEGGGAELSFGRTRRGAGLLGRSPQSGALGFRGGDILATPASEADILRFAESWRASPEESLFRSRPLPASPPQAPAITLADLPEEVRVEAATACLREGVTEASLLRDCTLDVGKTGHAGFAASAGRVQEAIDANPDTPPVVVATGVDPIEEIGVAVVQAAEAIIAEQTATSAGQADASIETVAQVSGLPTEGGPTTVVAYGDVHLRTLGGITFDVPLTGEFMLNASESGRLQIQARLSEWNREPGTSVISALSAKIEDNIVEVYHHDDESGFSVYVNGNILGSDLDVISIGSINNRFENSVSYFVNDSDIVFTLVKHAAGNHSFKITNDYVTIFRLREAKAGGAVAIHDVNRDLKIGLLGYRDDSPSEALAFRDGSVLAMPVQDNDILRFAESWRVSPGESMFKSRPLEVPTSAVPTISLADLSEEIRIEAATACLREGVTEARLLRDCTLDVGKTGHTSFAAGAADVQAALDANPDTPPVVVATGVDPIEEIGVAVVQAAVAAVEEEPSAPRIRTGGPVGRFVIPARPSVSSEPAPASPPAPAAAQAPEPVAPGPGMGGALDFVEMERGRRYAANGHYLIFQEDGNLCVYREADNGWVWCINNDPSIPYADTARVRTTQAGQLIGENGDGVVLYALPQVTPFTPVGARISAEGALEVYSADGVLWSSRH